MLENCTFKNVYKNGVQTSTYSAIYLDSYNATINDRVFHNLASKEGSAIYINDQLDQIINCVFTDNYDEMVAKGQGGILLTKAGGAIYISAKNTTLENSIFRDNEAKNGPNYAVYTTNSLYVNDINNTYINNYEADYGGNAEDDDENIPSYHENKKTLNKEKTNYNVRNIAKITVKKNNKEIKINNNQLTLATLNNIFGLNFTNGHLLVYIDGKLVFNGTTTDDLSQIIYNLLNLLSGNHEIKVEFTDNEGKTNTYTETITV